MADARNSVTTWRASRPQRGQAADRGHRSSRCSAAESGSAKPAVTRPVGCCNR